MATEVGATAKTRHSSPTAPAFTREAFTPAGGVHNSRDRNKNNPRIPWLSAVETNTQDSKPAGWQLLLNEWAQANWVGALVVFRPDVCEQLENNAFTMHPDTSKYLPNAAFWSNPACIAPPQARKYCEPAGPLSSGHQATRRVLQTEMVVYQSLNWDLMCLKSMAAKSGFCL